MPALLADVAAFVSELADAVADAPAAVSEAAAFEAEVAAALAWFSAATRAVTSRIVRESKPNSPLVCGVVVWF